MTSQWLTAIGDTQDKVTVNVGIVPFLLDMAGEYLGLLGGPTEYSIPEVVDVSCDRMLASVP